MLFTFFKQYKFVILSNLIIIQNLFFILKTNLLNKIVKKSYVNSKNSLKAVLFTKTNQFFKILIKIK